MTHPGNLIRVEDKINQLLITRRYDTFGNVTHEELGNGLALSNTYDAINRRTALSLPDGSLISYKYDPLYLREIKREDKNKNTLYTHTYSQYDTEGNVTEMNLIRNVGSLSFDYDPKGNCIAIDSSQWSQSIAKTDSDVDANILTIKGHDPVSPWQSIFTYNDRNQLSSEKGLFRHSYAYDEFQNRISKRLMPMMSTFLTN